MILKKLLTLALCWTLSCADTNNAAPSSDRVDDVKEAASEDSGEPAGDDTKDPDPADTSSPTETNESTAEPCPVITDSDEHKQLYDHNVYSVSSADGLSFSQEQTLLLEHASVPDGVVRPDGKTWVYYVNGNPGQHAIFVAELNADGSALEPFDCIRIDGKVVGDAVDPDIVLLPDGRYRLFYYHGWFVTKPTNPNAPHPFYSAISDNGIHFKVENLLLETTDGGTDPSAARLSDGSWLMSITLKGKVAITQSKDGAKFELTGHEFPQGISELHRFDDGTVRLYISGKGMAIWKSTDKGVTWEQELTAQVKGHDPSIVKNTDGSYTLFTKTVQGGDKPNNPPANEAALTLSELTAIDDDGIWTPGEALIIAVTLTNHSDKSIGDPGAWLNTKDPVVNIVEEMVFVDSLGPGKSAALNFKVSANDDTPTPYKLPFMVVVTNKECKGNAGPDCPAPYQLHFTANIGVEPIVELKSEGSAPKPKKP
jgi:hypothetical protein